MAVHSPNHDFFFLFDLYVQGNSTLDHFLKFSDAEVLRFANYYTDHMVLQMAPAKANIWGYTATVGENVTVYLNSTQVATVQSGPRPEAKSGGMWSALLPAQTAGTSYTVKIESGDERTMLEDVLFGDVWVCSGQSNMYFTVNSVSRKCHCHCNCMYQCKMHQ